MRDGMYGVVLDQLVKVAAATQKPNHSFIEVDIGGASYSLSIDSAWDELGVGKGLPGAIDDETDILHFAIHTLKVKYGDKFRVLYSDFHLSESYAIVLCEDQVFKFRAM